MKSITCFNLPRILLSSALLLAMCPISMAQQNQEYRVNPERSWIRVLVYRGGLLGGLGHNHVVSHTQISGTAAVFNDTTDRRASFEIQLPLGGFEVDRPEIRAIEGDDFPGEISAKDIAGTTKNMLGRKLLDSERYPFIEVRSVAASGTLPEIVFDTIVTLRAQEHTLKVPTSIKLSEGSFTVVGEFSLSHSEIGLSPFKAAFGTLRVRDKMIVKFEFHGEEILATTTQ